MDLQDLLSRFAVALGIGLLIGLERGWRTREMQSGRRAAGIRTFAVSGLLGAVVATLGQAAGSGGGFVLGAGFAAFAAVMIVFCREENRASGNFSATTAIAAILTFALGSFAVIGDIPWPQLPHGNGGHSCGAGRHPQLGRAHHSARVAVSAGAAGNDVHCSARSARRPDRTIWRGLTREKSG